MAFQPGAVRRHEELGREFCEGVACRADERLNRGPL
jgi:hypothetical protein